MAQDFLFQMGLGALIGVIILVVVLKPHFKKNKPATQTTRHQASPQQKTERQEQPKAATAPFNPTSLENHPLFRLVSLFISSKALENAKSVLNEQANIQNMNDADILEMARQGNKLMAIKAWRLKYGCSLKDAKEAVESRL